MHGKLYSAWVQGFGAVVHRCCMGVVAEQKECFGVDLGRERTTSADDRVSVAPLNSPNTGVGGGFDELYRRERPGLLRLAFLLVGSVEAAEDVFHDAVASVAPHLDSADKPGAYLRSAVVNAANMWHRKADRSLPEPTDPVVEGLDDRTVELWQTVNLLTERRRTAVVLRYYLDLPVKEIAEHMDCAPGTVSSLLHRAMADMRKELGDG